MINSLESETFVQVTLKTDTIFYKKKKKITKTDSSNRWAENFPSITNKMLILSFKHSNLSRSAELSQVHSLQCQSANISFWSKNLPSWSSCRLSISSAFCQSWLWATSLRKTIPLLNSTMRISWRPWLLPLSGWAHKISSWSCPGIRQ